MKKQSRELIACALWIAALALITFGTADSIRAGHNMPFLAWGLFLSAIACALTVSCVVKMETERRADVTIERIVEVVDALHQGRNEVSRLH